MPGNHSGVTKSMNERFPSVIVRHFVNYKLKLSVSDAVHAVLGINQFKSFANKPYHASPKNSRELHACAKLLELKLLLIR
jgi:hypothetical protein